MTEREKCHNGLIYDSGDPEIAAEQAASIRKLYEFNSAPPWEEEKRARLLREMCAEVGEGCYAVAPIHANFGCRFLHLGKGVYLNYNFTIVDDTDIYIGDHVLIGPNVTLTVSGHAVWPELRNGGLQFSEPIHIGNRVWLGAGVIVMPGVTIGDDSVVGAGSVVTKDIPAGVVAVGNPCHVLREINEHDKEYYFKDRKIPAGLIEAERQRVR